MVVGCTTLPYILQSLVASSLLGGEIALCDTQATHCADSAAQTPRSLRPLLYHIIV